MPNKGPKQSPAAIHQLKGTYRRDRHGDADFTGFSVVGKNNIPVAPEHLSPDAANLWGRLIYEMASVPGWLVSTDLLLLEDYCECSSECKRLKCSWTASRYKHLIDDGKKMVVNPTYKVWQEQERYKTKLAAELGLGPVARNSIKLMRVESGGNAPEFEL